MVEIENNNWVVQFYAALEKSEANDAPSKLLISKVPSHMRTIAQHYEHQYWKFGLHHCSQSVLDDEPEGLKVEVARALQLTSDQWHSFCNCVVIEPKEYWETMYCHSPHANLYTIDEIKCRLSLDALFIVVFLQRMGGGGECFGSTLQKVMNPIHHKYCSSIREAFCLVENQIPMELLKRVVNILVMEFKDHVGMMPEWDSENWQVGWNIGNCVEWGFFGQRLINQTEMDEIFETRMDNRLLHANSYHGVHILDSIYRMLSGWESLEATYEKLCPPRYSATHLEACGITIKGKEFTCFEDISFEKGCLSVPFLQVYSGTETCLRNLVVYESITRLDRQRRYAVICYTAFMEGLMRTREDVILLEKWGIIYVGVGSHDIVVDMWKHINHRIIEPRITDKFFTMMVDMNNYMKQRRNKYRFEFRKKFCSRPWIPLSYLAATIVTLATLLQTYVAIIGSNGMKPHFVPQH